MVEPIRTGERHVNTHSLRTVDSWCYLRRTVGSGQWHLNLLPAAISGGGTRSIRPWPVAIGVAVSSQAIDRNWGQFCVKSMWANAPFVPKKSQVACIPRLDCGFLLVFSYVFLFLFIFLVVSIFLVVEVRARLHVPLIAALSFDVFAYFCLFASWWWYMHLIGNLKSRSGLGSFSNFELSFL